MEPNQIGELYFKLKHNGVFSINSILGSFFFENPPLNDSNARQLTEVFGFGRSFPERKKNVQISVLRYKKRKK